MLTNIKLENFKCFRELDLKCAPLTLLTGINGTGKSSVFQALILLRQTQEESRAYEAKSLVLDGQRVELGTPNEILFEGATRIEYRLDWTGENQYFEIPFEKSPDGDRLEPAYEDIDLEDHLVEFLWGHDHSLLNEKLAYVSAERAGPRNMYPSSSDVVRRDDIGYGGELAWSYLYNNRSLLFEENDLRCLGTGTPRLIDVTNQWLQSICPGARVELEHIEVAKGVAAKYAFDRSGGRVTRPYRPNNVGFGLSYTLPVIVALLMPTGSLCLIENPEAHLHPSGQTEMARLAARAAKTGVQVMVETHSDHFIDGIRIAVREGLLTPDDVAIHYFERQGDESVVTSPVIDADGRLSEWPAGFFDQHEMNLVRLLRPIQGG